MTLLILGVLLINAQLIRSEENGINRGGRNGPLSLLRNGGSQACLQARTFARGNPLWATRCLLGRRRRRRATNDENKAAGRTYTIGNLVCRQRNGQEICRKRLGHVIRESTFLRLLLAITG